MSEDKKKIIIVVDTLDLGGAEVSATKICNEAANNNYTVELIVIRNKGVLEKTISNNVKIVHLNKKKVSHAFFYLINYLKNNNVDLIISYLNHVNLLVLISTYLFTISAKVIIAVHSPLNYSEHIKISIIKTFFFKKLICFFYPKAYKIAAVSHGVKSSLLQQIFKNNKKNNIEVIYNPISLVNFNEIKKNLINGNKKFRYIFVGRLIKDKGILGIIDSFREANNEIDSELYIYGTGNLEEDIKLKVIDNNLEDSIKILGYKSNIDEIYTHADCLIMNSSFESFGNVIIEALNYRCDIISSDCPVGPRELLRNGEFGSLFQLGNTDELTKLMIKSAKLKKKQNKEFNSELNEYLKTFEISFIFKKLIGTKL